MNDPGLTDLRVKYLPSPLVDDTDHYIKILAPFQFTYFYE